MAGPEVDVDVADDEGMPPVPPGWVLVSVTKMMVVDGGGDVPSFGGELLTGGSPCELLGGGAVDDDGGATGGDDEMLVDVEGGGGGGDVGGEGLVVDVVEGGGAGGVDDELEDVTSVVVIWGGDGAEVVDVSAAPSTELELLDMAKVWRFRRGKSLSDSTKVCDRARADSTSQGTCRVWIWSRKEVSKLQNCETKWNGLAKRATV